MSDTEDLVAMLSNLTTKTISENFGAKDNTGITSDCIKIFQEYGATTDDVVYGLYHNYNSTIETWSVHLACNFVGNFGEWQHIAKIDTYASQPAVWVNEDGTFLLAWERTGTPDKNYIRLRYYKSIDDLKKGTYSDTHDMPRTLAPDCEGTPSFESVKINGSL